MTAIWWIRRDFRLSDNPALVAAAGAGQVIPVFIRDETVDALGAAPKFRLGLGLGRLIETIEDAGGRVILRTGAARDVLRDLLRETGALAVHWSRLYDGESVARDTAVKSALREAGVTACSHPGHLLFEPWCVTTRQGGYYKVYSPFWRAVRDIGVGPGVPKPALRWPSGWPDGDRLADWALGTAMRRGAEVVAGHCHVGEAAARGRLSVFLAQHVEDYGKLRDFPAEPACSGLSENLAYGEISARTVWHAGHRALEEGKAGAEAFLRELVWREFAWHLLYHEPGLPTESHRDGWEAFPWRTDDRLPEIAAWKRGRTGVPFVDAAMREMYVTGRMHNRARMIVASYLTKHLLVDWRVGRRWFEDCLVDWDPASNALGWQWVAGCGPDAAPYFRIFNPKTQAEKFDPEGSYLRRWIAEREASPTTTALSYFDAIPVRWAMAPDDAYPAPVVGLKEGRDRALAAYETVRGG
ncbi:cryptochrome/photolyase family protein [Celeribacter indicus]|uniref:Deoxyribodipyrimidine photo-lyase n=1 Tax=Celeribacter indicus TaxID=1208324 RepID=A0A0B5E4F8_9RHOB|nr:deoxyribodipyrimidine photo-lyase [Celeribacter indicus]AJE47232.1 deoxyribodipyrimidine photo-lyase [Celeribacter indicus]SDW01176.1 deoxyribodipyrimidine photo-lyase [Celeribacter indicus]